MVDHRLIQKRKHEFWQMVKLQGNQLIKIFEYYGGCEHCEHSLCCKINPPVVQNAELPRIAKYKKMSNEDFLNKYLVKYDFSNPSGEIENDFLINTIPCPFLKNNKCTIYPVRPMACKYYPFQPAIKEICLEGIDICPTATLISSDVWVYQQELIKKIPKNVYEDAKKKAEKEFKKRENSAECILNPLDELYKKLNIDDIGMQNYIETYHSVFFMDVMLRYNRI